MTPLQKRDQFVNVCIETARRYGYTRPHDLELCRFVAEMMPNTFGRYWQGMSRVERSGVLSSVASKLPQSWV